MQKNQFNRRDFLKLLSLMPAAYHLKPDSFPTAQDAATQGATQPNFIVLVFDAWSASNTSLYGYPRQTTPFLEKLAEKGIVYHNHYAGGHWTYPGTVSLLTGTLPWRHRGYKVGFPYQEAYKTQNIFGMFPDYFRSAYTHNQIADEALLRMIGSISSRKPRQELYIDEDFWLSKLFEKDYDTASTAWIRAAKKFDDGYANSLFLSRVFDLYNDRQQKEYQQDYPLGVPVVELDNYFLLNTAIDWIAEQAAAFSQPFLGYYHLLPPHDPYRPRREFVNTFKDDGYVPTEKPEHPMTLNLPGNRIPSRRKEYDEFILFVDSEINRLYDMLSANNLLENTWLIITSDHGEMFERGIMGHLEPTFHNPLVHIPLVILPPGQQERIDITTPTSAIDLLPTLRHITGKSAADWMEGELLPPFNTSPNSERKIFSMDARFSASNTAPFTAASIMLRQGDYKLTYMFGDQNKYEPLGGKPLFELYNLKEDPEELTNLYDQEPAVVQALFETMKAEMEYNGVL